MTRMHPSFRHALCLLLWLLFVSLAQADEATTDAAIAAPREFMLTFDDGPLPGKTDKVLAALAKLHAADGSPVKAAFFMVGDAPDSFWTGRKYYAPYEIWINKGSMLAYPELVAQVKQAGHFIGSHTAHHAWFHWPWLSDEAAITEELQSWEVAAGPLPNQVKLFRPPYLIDTPASRAAAAKLGYQTVLGYTVGDASPFSSVEGIKQNILRILAQTPIQQEPVVLIFHDILPITYENLTGIVEFLQQKGHHLVSFNPDQVNQASTAARVTNSANAQEISKPTQLSF